MTSAARETARRVTALTPPPPDLVATREALRSLACYVIAPARKARTGRIGLRPTGDGIATPPFDDGTRIGVRGDRLVVATDDDVPITTLRAGAARLGIALSDDPGVGHDLPPFAPDRPLPVDADASRWLAAWYAYGAGHLERLHGRFPDAAVSEAQLWPEHFDLAVTVDVGGDAVNVGFSPGDGWLAEPYVYVGPHDTSDLTDAFWNAPFGSVLTHAALRAAADPDGACAGFIDDGLRLVASRPR